jgi:hypothetical protein
MTMRTINPATEEVIETFDARTPAQTDEILTPSRLPRNVCATVHSPSTLSSWLTTWTLASAAPCGRAT